MKNELGYFAWNGFLAASLLAAKFFGVYFPVQIVGVLAVIEVSMWLLAIVLMADKAFRKIIREKMPVKIWRLFTESAMVAIPVYCGNLKIAAAWVMIAGIGFAISAMAKDAKEDAEADTSGAL